MASFCIGWELRVTVNITDIQARHNMFVNLLIRELTDVSAAVCGRITLPLKRE